MQNADKKVVTEFLNIPQRVKILELVDNCLGSQIRLGTLSLLLAILLIGSYYSSPVPMQSVAVKVIFALLCFVLLWMFYLIGVGSSLRRQVTIVGAVNLWCRKPIEPAKPFEFLLKSDLPGLEVRARPLLTWYLPISGSSPLPLHTVDCDFSSSTSEVTGRNSEYVISGVVPKNVPFTGMPYRVDVTLRVRSGFAVFEFFLPVVDLSAGMTV